MNYCMYARDRFPNPILNAELIRYEEYINNRRVRYDRQKDHRTVAKR